MPVKKKVKIRAGERSEKQVKIPDTRQVHGEEGLGMPKDLTWWPSRLVTANSSTVQRDMIFFRDLPRAVGTPM